jgi:hypothetical protein
MAEVYIEIIGWVGTFLILAAYFLLTYKKLKSESKIYHSMNLIGGLSIVVNGIANHAYPPAGLNTIWSLIAAYGIIKGIGKPKKVKR